MSRDYDVIVVGSGAAGLAASYAAREAGASVLLVEADKVLGGASRFSGGVFYAGGTSIQKARGIEDSPEAMFEYYQAFQQWQNRPDLIWYFCQNAAPSLEWLISLGVSYFPEGLACGGVEQTPRSHPCRGAGAEIVATLVNEIGVMGVETAVDNRVDSLIFENGRVVGIRASGAEVRAGSVVITTGGFANNHDLFPRWFPRAAALGPQVWALHHHAPFVQGDALGFAEQIGAGINGHDSGLFLPTNEFARVEEAWLPEWTMAVNREGRRFMPEYCAYGLSGHQIEYQTGKSCFAIFDETALKEGDTKYADPYNVTVSFSTWTEDDIRAQIAKGKAIVADSLDELAARCGIDAVTLAETVKRYNADCHAGRDSEYHKKAKRYFPVETGPFYAVEVKPTLLGMTHAGFDLDSSMRVRDPHTRVIPGVYAAGEVVGWVVGPRYAGTGNSIGQCITFGRLAGATAAADAMALQG